MAKTLKVVLIAVGSLLALLLVAVGIVVATFDPNDYKPLLVQRVQQQTQRTLAIPGPIGLSFWPSLGVKLGAVSLSEPRSNDTFASLRSAHVSLALWPLLKKQLIVDRIEIDGLQARLVRGKDGQLNIDDLLGKPAAKANQAEAPAAGGAPQQALQFDVAGIAIEDAAITVDDRQAPRKLVLSKASIRTGRLVPGQPTDASFKGHLTADAPAVDADIALKTGLTFDLEQRRHTLKDLSVELGGRVATLSDLKASVAAPEFKLEGDRLAAPKLGVQLQFRQGAMALKTQLDAALAGDLVQQKFNATSLALSADVTLPPDAPVKTVALKAGGSAAVDVAKHQLDAALEGQLDQSKFQLKFGMPNFSPAAYRFDVEIDRIDLDRYRSTAAPAATASAPAGPEKPIDLSALRDLNASGSLRVGALQVANLKTTALRADLHAAGGRAELKPLQADLYEGKLAGSLAVVASTVPRVTVQQTLTGIAIGPLLKDALGKPMLEGRGNVTLDVAAQGATVSALTKALAGSAKLELRNGMVRGINIAQTIRSAKAKLGLGGGSQGGTGSQSESTDFSALTASFKITDGVAHNDDLSLLTPLLRVGGNGDVDLGESRLDYLVKATVVATLEGQGGPELQALRGQTVPVRLSGPFSAIGYKIDFAGMAKEIAKDKLDDKAKDAAAKAKERLGDKLKGLLKK